MPNCGITMDAPGKLDGSKLGGYPVEEQFSHNQVEGEGEGGMEAEGKSSLADLQEGEGRREWSSDWSVDCNPGVARFLGNLVDGERCSEREAAELLLGLMLALVEYRKPVGGEGTLSQAGDARREGEGRAGTIIAPCGVGANLDLMDSDALTLVDLVRNFMTRVGNRFFVPLELSGMEDGPNACSSSAEASRNPEAADVWAAGSLLYYVLSGRVLWALAPGHESERMIVREEGMVDLFTHPWHLISAEARHLLARMLRVDPSSRASPPEVIEHAWVRARGAPASMHMANGLSAKGEGGCLPGSPYQQGAEANCLAGDVMPHGTTLEFLSKDCPGRDSGLGRGKRPVGGSPLQFKGVKGSEKEREGRKWESWRRGSTEFEVFSPARGDWEEPRATPPPGTSLKSSLGVEDSEVRPASSSPLAGPAGSPLQPAALASPSKVLGGGVEQNLEGGLGLARTESSASVVFAGEDQDELQPTISAVQKTESADGGMKPRGCLKTSFQVAPSREASRTSQDASPPFVAGTHSSPLPLGPAGSPLPPADESSAGRGEASTEGASDESEVAKLRAKRRQERQATVRFATVPSRGHSKPTDSCGSGGGSEGSNLPDVEAKPEQKHPRSIRDLFMMDDRGKGGSLPEGTSVASKVVPAPSSGSESKKDSERRGILRITSASAADALLRKSRKDRESSMSFKEQSSRDHDAPIVRTRKTTPPEGGGSMWGKKPMLTGLRSLIRRSTSEKREQVEPPPEEEVSSDYAAALSAASRRVERELLNSVRPGRKAIPMPSGLVTASEQDAPERGEASSGEAEKVVVPPVPVDSNAAEEPDPAVIEVDDVVHLVEVGDSKVRNLLEDFSAILVREQEEAAKGGGGEPPPEAVQVPLPVLDDLMGAEEPPERQNMVVDDMGRRLLQGPMAHPHPRRKHGRSSHVFC